MWLRKKKREKEGHFRHGDSIPVIGTIRNHLRDLSTIFLQAVQLKFAREKNAALC